MPFLFGLSHGICCSALLSRVYRWLRGRWVVWPRLVLVQIDNIRQLKEYNYTNCTLFYVFFVYMITPGSLNESRRIDGEVKSDLAGGSRHSTSME